MDTHHGFLGRPGRQAEDLARLRVQPGVLVVDALLGLDVQIPLVRFRELLRRNAEEPSWTSMNLAIELPPVRDVRQVGG